MKKRFIILTVITFSLLSLFFYKLTESGHAALENIENSAAYHDYVAVEESGFVGVSGPESYLFHNVTGIKLKNMDVSESASSMTVDETDEVGSGQFLEVSASWFENPSDAECHYINLFSESEVLSDYLLNSVCIESTCML